MADTSGEEIRVPDIPNNDASRIAYMNTQKHSIKNLSIRQKKDKEPLLNAINNLDMFLAWLATSLEMTPYIKEQTSIDSVLKIIVNPAFKYGATYVSQATALLEKWELEKYGKDLLVDEVEEETADIQVAPTVSAASSTTTNTSEPATASIRAPPRDHPIFGLNGIMHGVVVVKTPKTTTYRIDTRYRAQNAKVFGHNNIAPGTWYPMQIVALFNGAHGSRMGGIAGSEEGGAYVGFPQLVSFSQLHPRSGTNQMPTEYRHLGQVR